MENKSLDVVLSMTTAASGAKEMRRTYITRMASCVRLDFDSRVDIPRVY